MAVKFGASIGVQLLRFVFGCYFIVTIVVTTIQLYLEYSNVEKNIIIELDNIGRSFEKSLSVSIWAYDLETIQSILDGIQKIEIVAGTKVKGKTDDVQKFSGLYPDEKNTLKLKEKRSFNELQVQEILVVANGKHGPSVEHSLYEYKLSINYMAEAKNSLKNEVGALYIYADKHTVINRFKGSLFLIIINAALKTFSLWVIFLFFSRRLLSAPLLKLTKATVSFSSDKECDNELLTQLNEYAVLKPENELKQLTNNFLSMRHKILHKINQLNNLNFLAITFTQAEHEIGVFDKVHRMLFELLGVSDIVVLDEKRQPILFLGKISEDLYKIISIKENDFYLDVLRGQGQISYVQGKISAAENLNKFMPLLYIPIFYNNKMKNEIWLSGKINKENLQPDETISNESLSLLQVIAQMIAATLSNIYQRNLIEAHNKTLENRVAERTLALEEANKELRYIALHDTLTKLPNRALFNDRLTQTIELAHRNNTHFALLNIDVTDFKKINDSYGHDAGDLVLIEIGKRLSNALRKCDTVARMGGDEFAGILVESQFNDSCPVAVTRMLLMMEDAISLNKNESVLVSINIGIAIFPDQTTDLNILLKYADIAMYNAKREGLGYAVYDPSKLDHVSTSAMIGFELEKALDKDEFFLHYQPIVSLKSGQLISVEALIRWNHPVKGLILPDDFIYVAERTNIIKSLTYLVLKKACQQYIAWKKEGFLTPISINVSSRTLSSIEFPAKFAAIVSEAGLECSVFTLEITEAAAMKNCAQTLQNIEELTRLGFSMSIDDFGTGYSSLSYLNTLPVKEVKMDKSFLLFENNKNSLLVVEGIINLAHSLNFQVIAEGVEDKKTLEILRAKGCDSVQGFYICKPNNSDEIIRWHKDFIGK